MKKYMTNVWNSNKGNKGNTNIIDSSQGVRLKFVLHIIK
jgi:hypothetical protein